MSAFKWRHFVGEVILWAVVALPLRTSYREFEEMLDERGGEVDLARSRRAGVPH